MTKRTLLCTAEFNSVHLNALQTFDHLVAGAFIVPRFASDTIRKHLAVITVSFPRGVDRVVVEKLTVSNRGTSICST